MASDLNDLVGFLASPSPQLKKAAVDIVQGLTGAEDGLRVLTSRSAQLLSPLLNLLADAQDIAQPAAEALLNLAQESSSVDEFLEAGAVEKVMEVVGIPGCSVNRLLVMLLVNLLLVIMENEGDEKLAGSYVSRLVRFFCRFSGDKEGEDAFEHVAAILVNVTRVLKSGRKLVLDQSSGLFKQILPQIDSRSLIRRQGIAGTVRNCCFEAEDDLPSLLLASSFLWQLFCCHWQENGRTARRTLRRCLFELATRLSFERGPEEDPQVRIETADALYLIAIQFSARKYQPERASMSCVLYANCPFQYTSKEFLLCRRVVGGLFGMSNGPRILQVGYEFEEDPKVMEAYERLGSLLVEES